jgi:metal-dependent hydrolase (beta-lactamase superfamily II)
MKLNTIYYLTDFNPISASHNAQVLGLDLSCNEIVISSHGHIDHSGGLINISKKIDEKKQEQKIPLILHKDAFRNRMVEFRLENNKFTCS